MVALIQNRWSKKDAATVLNKHMIAEDIVKTVKHDSFLHGSINDGRVCIIHLPFRKVQVPKGNYGAEIRKVVEAEADRMVDSGKKSAAKKVIVQPNLSPELRMLALKLANASVVLRKDNFKKILEPSFVRRPAYNDIDPESIFEDT